MSHGEVRRRTGAPVEQRRQRQAQQQQPSPQQTSPQQTSRTEPHQPVEGVRRDYPGQASIPERNSTESDPREKQSNRAVVRWWLLGVIALVAAIIFSVLEAPMFEAHSVQLSGNARTSEGLVLEALAIPDDQALALYDIEAAEASVGALPWVSEVDIVRLWPGTVQVVLKERGVAASIGRPDGREWLVVADDGIVVERRATPPGGVPLIVATHGVVDRASVGQPVEEAAHALEVVLDIPAQLDPWITTWSIDDAGSLTAELVGSAQANFGSFEEPRTQFVSLASIVNGGAELTCLARIDLSVADTPVLHRDRACITASAELG